ncbi:hypothetical protein HDU87_007063 [Geranomyces variabilis]|uniref:Uncharacterized protein n=1 Tax=Geranomyces variabilis TaxID=109894 RepID=A0AAD5XQ43_9FUNG|nr:hypothetical protein HDU87_007063 [Geranomyces variabilis]
MPSLFCNSNKVSARTSAESSKRKTSSPGNNKVLMTSDLFFSLPRGGGCIAHPQPSKPQTKKAAPNRSAIASTSSSSAAAADLFAHIPRLHSVLSPPPPSLAIKASCCSPRRRSCESSKPKASAKPATSSAADLFAHVPVLGCLLARKEKPSSLLPPRSEKGDWKQACAVPKQKSSSSSSAASDASLFARVPGMGCFVLPEALLAQEAVTTPPPAYSAAGGPA